MGLYAITDRGGEETSAIKWTKDEEDSDDVLLKDEEEDDDEKDEKEKDEKKKKKDKKDASLSRSTKVLIGTAATAVVGGVGAVALAPVILGAVGFTSAGIAAGSYAASMMSAAAVANGGGVAVGSLVAVLQSAGAAGLSGFATAAVAGTGATVTGFLGGLFGRKVIKETDEEKNKDKK